MKKLYVALVIIMYVASISLMANQSPTVVNQSVIDLKDKELVIGEQAELDIRAFKVTIDEHTQYDCITAITITKNNWIGGFVAPTLQCFKVDR